MNEIIGRVVFALVILLASIGFPAEQPNILLILIDDVGYTDVGAFSARINNTTIDKLRANCDDDYLPKPNPEYDPEVTLPYGPYVPLERLKASPMRKADLL